ncbi:MAG: hypothetical protein H7Y00_12715, partial [Fimbriimonadaceae bacterium]|nr:hypothetical protein [Chitinophagales bacterium]
PVHAEIINDSINIFATYTDDKTEKTSLYKCVFNLSMQQPVAPEFILSAKIENVSIYASFNFIYSSDSSLFAIISLSRLSSGTDLHVMIYERGFKKITDKMVSLRHGITHIISVVFKLSNTGNLFFSADLPSLKQGKTFGYIPLWNSNLYMLPKNETILKEFNFKSINEHVEYLKYDVFEGDKVVYAIEGYPLEKKDENFVKIGILDIQNGEIIYSKNYLPGDEIVRKLSNTRELGLSNKSMYLIFMPREIKVGDDGGIYFIGEQQTYTTPGSGGGTGLYDYYNMLAVKFDADFNTQYETLIPRREQNYSEISQYMKIGSEIANGKLHIYYTIREDCLNSESVLDCKQGNYWSNVYVEAIISEIGEVKKKVFFNGKDSDVFPNFISMKFHNTDNTTILFDDGMKPKSFRLGSIRME